MPVRIRAALSCVAYDIPATKQVYGFLGHNAKLGCNKCLKVFAQRKNRRGKLVAVYGGYNRENWTLRNNQQHSDRVVQLKNVRAISTLCKAESSLGICYSVSLSPILISFGLLSLIPCIIAISVLENTCLRFG